MLQESMDFQQIQLVECSDLTLFLLVQRSCIHSQTVWIKIYHVRNIFWFFNRIRKDWTFPSTKETPRPRASGIVRMSEKIIAASKSYLSIGCKTNSQQISGVLHISRKFLKFDLTFLYSGRYLPACLIIHMGRFSESLY